MKNKLIFITALVFFVLILASSAYGADNDQSIKDSSIANYALESSPSTVYVNPVTGNDTNNGTSPDNPFKTITKGVNSVADEGTVNLSAGTYQENVIMIQKSLTITGAGEDSTILDGKNNNRVFYIYSGKTVTIQNLSITRGIGKPDGGGIYNDGTLTLTSCKLYNNTTPNGRNANKSDDANPGGNGGAIYNTSNGNLTINNCEIYNNRTGNGGNACSHLMDRGSAEHGGYGGAIYNSGILKLQNSNIYENTAGKGGHSSDVHPGAHGGHGGAIYNNKNAQLTITNCTINNNKAGEGGKRDNTCNTTSGDGGNGGAIYNDGILKITGTQLEKNRAGQSGTVTQDGQSAYDGNGGNGGAIYNDGDGQLTITNSKLNENKAGMAGYKHSGGNGGAIYNKGVLNITESEISHNRAGSDLINGPEGKDISHGKGNAIYSDCEKTVKINFCSFEDNRTMYLNKDKDVIWYDEQVYLKEYKSTDTDLKNNWWGTNNDNDELANLVKGKDDITKYYNPYLKLTITVDPSTIEINGTSNVTASLRINSAGENTYVPIDWMHIPDGVEVKYSSFKGSVQIKNTTTTAGIATTTFLPTKVGDVQKPGVVYATAGKQKVSATIIIQNADVKMANVRMMLRTKYSPETDTLEYLLRAINTGPNMATGLKISMPLPEDTVYMSHTVCWNGKDWIDQDPSYDPATGIWDLSNKNIIKYQYPQLKLELEPLKHSQIYEITITRTAQTEINNEPNKIERKHWVSEPLAP